MQSWEAFYGPNVGYVLEQYERFLQDPKSVEPETRAFFAQMGQLGDLSAAATTLARPATRTSRSSAPNGRTTQSDAGAAPSANGGSAPASESPGGFVAPAHTMDDHQVATIVFAARLARSIREYGHLDAMIDPLGAPRPGDPMLDARTHTITDDELAGLPGSIVFPAGSGMSCLDAIQRLRAIYCGASGYEFDHVQDYEERTWLHSVVESGAFHATLSTDQRRSLLHRLSQVEGFERFLHTVFQGQKRFSIEGNDTLVPILDAVLDEGAETGIREVVIGMAHRGRLNVLAHVLGKSYSDIFGEFHTARKREHAVQSSASVGDGGGDVKYHRGAYHEVRRGSSTLAITLSDNPSHLEVVNPVTEGFTRATQDDRSRPGRPVQDLDRALCITIHGDAAFPGEGVVAETLNLSRLPGYHTGGTIHIIVNNQIGFTTRTEDARSTLYSSDLAKGFEIPIVHVNADDPEACVSVARLASAYRRRFHKDFLIDLVGYRRWGHNEGDEPAFTQPAMYAEVRSHPSVRALYAGRLVGDAVLSDGDAETMVQTIQQELRSARDDSEQTLPAPTPESETIEKAAPKAVTQGQLRSINEALLSYPDDFTVDAKLERLMGRRREAIDRPGGIDWALAEVLAFASILAEGTPIRLTGQDTERGTFSQRHLVLHDPLTDRVFVPLQSLPQAQASFAVYNSPLTETAVLGFEYGYSVHAAEAMVLWEAQYGDFANVGQVIVDQFIAAARAKWSQQPALTLLLPHGYEGAGPEHSSARLERYLQLAAEDNMLVAYPSTAAQYFHLLRLQAAALHGVRRPLIVMAPKSGLRRSESASSLNDLTSGSFRTVLDDPGAAERREQVSRLVLATGKIALDFAAGLKREPVEWVALARVEQLYPFPETDLVQLIGRYPNLKEIVWLQEEPSNMGAWWYIGPLIRRVLPGDLHLGYAGRSDRASTATGSPDAHQAEQARILDSASSREHPSVHEEQGE